MEQMSHRLGPTLGDLIRAEDVAEGKLEQARALLLRMGRKHFGEPDLATRVALRAVTHLERLEELCERMLDVNSWQELLQAP